MDPLSISASIAALLGLATSIAKSGYKIGKTFAGAEEEVLSLIAEVTGLIGVLHSLHFMISQFQSQDIEGATQSYPIQSCFTTLIKIESILKKCDASSAPNGPKSIGGIKRRLRWPLNIRETHELIDEVGRHKATLSLAINADGMSALLHSLSKQDKLANQVTELQASINATRKAKTVAELTKKRRAVLESFGKVDSQKTHDAAVNLRHPGTGIWFVEGEDFKRWINNEEPRLWLYGIPGAGKTILMSTIIAEAKKLEDETNGLAYFYCDYKDPETHIPANILQSLIRQLAIQKKEAFQEIEQFWELRTPDAKRAAFEIEEETQAPKTRLPQHTSHEQQESDPYSNEKDFVKLMQLISTHFDSVMILVDGLDECGEQRVSVTRLLATLVNPDVANIKIILSSRDEHEIRFQLDGYEKLAIAAKSSDVRLYVESEISTRIQHGRLRLRPEALKEGSLKDFMTEKLVEKGEGMFQWVKCQLDHLCQLPNDSARRKALDTLPPTLSSTYERILVRVNSQDEVIQSLVERVLRWVVFANSILTPAAIAEIVSVEDGDTQIHQDAIPTENDIMHWCSSLIYINPELGCLEPSHYSVVEFLMSIPVDSSVSPFSRFRVESESAHTELASRCLQYLLMDDFATGYIYKSEEYSAREEEHPFFQYACAEWDHHVTSAQGNKTHLTQLCYFFKPNKSQNFLAWSQERVLFERLMNHEEGDEYENDLLDNIAEDLQDVSTLHIAASLALADTVSWLISSGSDVNKLSRSLGTPILCASMGIAALQSLIQTDYESIGVVDEESWRLTCRMETLKTLLDAGANPNIGGRGGITALQQIVAFSPYSSGNDLDSIRMLCENGAICTLQIVRDAMEYGYSTSDLVDMFSKAVLSPEERLQILELLASYVDSESMRRLFGDMDDESKSKSNLSDEAYGRFIRETARWNQMEALNHYFEKDRNIDLIESGSEQTALHFAASNGHIEVVKFLIENNANRRAQDSDGDTPLHLACMFNHGEVAEYLWDLYEFRNLSGLTPLMLAASYCSADVFSSFLTRCNDETVFAKSLKGASLLHLAAASGIPSKVRALLDKGFEVNDLTNDLCTPIMYAIEHFEETDDTGMEQSEELVLQILVDNGADLHLQNVNQDSVLHLLSSPSNWECDLNLSRLTFLTRQDRIQLDCTNKFGITPVMLMALSFRDASQWEAETVLEAISILVENGASLDIQDCEGRSCLHIICELWTGVEGENAVKWLLDHDSPYSLKDIHQKTPLDLALETEGDNTGVIDFLLAKCSDLYERNDEGQTMLHRVFLTSSKPCFERIAKSVVARNVDFGLKDRHGKTILITALQANANADVLGMILSCIPEESLPNHTFAGSGPLNISIRCTLPATVIECLLRKTKDIDTRDAFGRTALHWTCSNRGISPKISRQILSRCNNLSIEDSSSWDSLFIAAFANNDWMVAELIAANVNLENRGDVKSQNGSERTQLTALLATVCEYANPPCLESAELLIEAGADILARDSSGWGMIHFCSMRGRETILRLLSEKSLDFSSQVSAVVNNDKTQMLTALHIAAGEGSTESVSLLLATGAFPDIDIALEDGSTPLIHAAAGGHLKTCDVICENGANLNVAKSTTGDTPLHVAVAFGSTPVVLLLLEKGADITLRNKAGVTAEFDALFKGRAEIAKLLQERAQSHLSQHTGRSSSSLSHLLLFDPFLTSHMEHITSLEKEYYHTIGERALDNNTLTPDSLHNSIEVGAIEFWKQLLRDGFNINTSICKGRAQHSNDKTSCYPLNVALGWRKLELAKLFLQNGADVHHQACTERSPRRPLSQSIGLADVDITRTILGKYELPLNAESYSAIAEAIDIAVMMGNIEILEQLCRYGNTERDGVEEKMRYSTVLDSGQSTNVLHIAISSQTKKEESIRLLLEHGADIDAVDFVGDSPLHYASAAGDCHMIDILLKCGAFIHARNPKMCTPVLRAATYGHLDAVKLLLNSGACSEDSDLYGIGLLHSAARAPGSDLALFTWLVAQFSWMSYVSYISEGSLLHHTLEHDYDSEKAIFLIENGANWLQVSRELGYPIHVSSHYGHYKVTRGLLSLTPADQIKKVLNYASRRHGTALFAASSQGHIKIVDMLLKAGASIDAWSDVQSGPATSGTALMIACINGHVDVAMLLLSNGAQVSIKNAEEIEVNALQAGRERCPKIIRILQQRGAFDSSRCSYMLPVSKCRES